MCRCPWSSSCRRRLCLMKVSGSNQTPLRDAAAGHGHGPTPAGCCSPLLCFKAPSSLRRTVYYREHASGTYSVLAYWAAGVGLQGCSSGVFIRGDPPGLALHSRTAVMHSCNCRSCAAQRCAEAGQGQGSGCLGGGVLC